MINKQMNNKGHHYYTHCYRFLLVQARSLIVINNNTSSTLFNHIVQRHFCTTSTTTTTNLKPKEILIKEKGSCIEIKYDDGNNNNKTHILSAEFLRVHSPSAEVKGHGSNPRIVFGRRFVRIIAADVVGNYAIRLIFDDLHETGIYSWTYLHELGEKKFKLMRKYLAQLKHIGKSRDPRKNTTTNRISNPPSSST